MSEMDSRTLARRIVVPTVLLLILSGAVTYLVLADTAFRQARNLRLARKHLPAVENITTAFNGPHTSLIAQVHTGRGGVIQVTGAIASVDELDELKRAIEGTRPPVEVIYRVTIEGGGGWDLNPAFIRQPAPRARLTIEEAREAVRSHVFRVTPDYTRDSLFTVKDVTPDEVWSRFGMQLLYWGEGHTTYLAHGPQLFLLGQLSPHPVLTVDLNRDGNAQLIYIRHWGSGILHAFIDIAERTDSELRIHRGIVFRKGGMCALRKMADDEVGLFESVGSQGDQAGTSSRRVGSLWLDAKSGKIWVTLRSTVGKEVADVVRDLMVNGGEIETFKLQTK